MSVVSLNACQEAAANQLTGPVCIIAGAGTGKTTTVTQRIARQVTRGAFSARDILAVTFTTKAAGELRARLATLDVRGVEARTFHSAALWMLTYLWSTYEPDVPLPRVLDSKYRLLVPIVQRLPMPYRFRPVRDIVAAIDFAANQRMQPFELSAALERAGIEPPLPDDLMIDTIDRYERAKQRDGTFDFEDVLARCTHLLAEHAPARTRIHDRFRAFTVDEYQDVNPLQQALLDVWIGERRDVCVVGDDHQTIYTFTGADSAYLLEFPERYVDAKVITLEQNYRSTAAILDVANTVARRLGGRRKELTAARPVGDDAPAVAVESFADASDEASWVADRCMQLHDDGVPWHEMAVLYRTRNQSTRFEQALGRRAIPVFVRGQGLLERDAWRQTARLIERVDDVARSVLDIVVSRGYVADGAGSGDAGDEEATRQADFAVIVAHAERCATLDAAPCSGARFVAQMRERFGHENDARGVQLMTLHSAKGLEYDCVFLPELIGGVLPYWKGRRKAPLDEERRLFFVGITRARTHLHLSWLTGGKRTPSIFLQDAGFTTPPPAAAAPAPPAARRGAARDELCDADQVVFDALRAWRSEAAAGKPAYTVLADRSLASIARARPTTEAALAACHGIGPTKLAKYGDDIVRIVGEHAINR